MQKNLDSTKAVVGICWGGGGQHFISQSFSDDVETRSFPQNGRRRLMIRTGKESFDTPAPLVLRGQKQEQIIVA